MIPVAAKVLDNSQQYNELRIGPRGHNKLVELTVRMLKREIQNPYHVLAIQLQSHQNASSACGNYCESR